MDLDQFALQNFFSFILVHWRQNLNLTGSVNMGFEFMWTTICLSRLGKEPATKPAIRQIQLQLERPSQREL